MSNLLIILGVLFFSLLIILPLVQKFAKPTTPEDAQKYQKIIGFLMAAMVIAMGIRFFMDQ